MFKKNSVKNVNVGPVSQCPPTTAATDRADLVQVTIDVLPDDLFLEIFDLYRENETRRSYVKSEWGWTTLAHVCQRWRGIILASPQRLQLRIICTPVTPVKASLDIWPPFPLVIIHSSVHFCGHEFQVTHEEGEENIIAALERRDRISDIHLFDLEKRFVEGRLLNAMQEPFPALTSLDLRYSRASRRSLILPDTFLGGSAPRLRSFSLHGIAFPTLPKFVLRATHIVSLRLGMPSSGYISISPEVMATCLATLHDLETLSISFARPLLSPRMTPPGLLPLTRAVLPSLTKLEFVGISEYLEDFTARIDTPLLDQLRIAFSMDFISDIPQLQQFVGRAQSLRPLNHAQVTFFYLTNTITLGSPARFVLDIQWDGPDQLLSSVTQICNDHFSCLSQVDQLNIHYIPEDPGAELGGKNEVDPSQWLELFRPFSGVRRLYVSDELEPLVASALRELTGERTMEVLPALEHLLLDELRPSGSARDDMEPFIAARQLSGRPIVVKRQNQSHLLIRR